MSNDIDWSKAPEGATHYLSWRRDGSSGFFGYENKDRIMDCNGSGEYVLKKDFWLWNVIQVPCACNFADGFLHIPTPEQIAAEERENAIQQMIEDADYDGKLVRGLFAKLYDAGYRKTEAAE